MNLRVYNTLTKNKEPFATVAPGKVGIYLCGPTVYKPAHIGHMVGPVVFDAIKRYLVYCGYDVTWVVNITDVDDKLIAESNRRGLPMGKVAEENIADYLFNLEQFGIDTIDEMPRATEYMDEIIDFIKSLIDQEFAYAVDGDVFFDVMKDEGYGKLSNRSPDEQQGEGGGAASKKKSPGDFALWKSAKPGEPSWDSPWGKGRPGWHIECSAMSRKILGKTFDIHGGGLDLVFPHHENEIAQSECCHGQPMVNYWMHNGLMRASAEAGKVGGRGDREQQTEGGGKISRSEGAGGLADLVNEQGGERLRFFLLRTHYRSTIVFGDEGLAEAATALETFYRFFDRYERVTGESFYEIAPATVRTEGELETNGDATLAEVARRRNAYLEKMDDDFNTGGAVSELFDLVRALNKYVDEQKLEESLLDNKLAVLKQGTKTLRELTLVLGLFREPPASDEGGDDDLVGSLMDLLIEIRASARQNKDFATADKIRESLAAVGITIEDRKGGTGWRRG
jgi:cysteinyl-tRNA synthetase